MIGYTVEAFVFAYLGLTVFSYGDYDWSPSLFFVELFSIFIGRAAGTYGLVYFLTLFKHKPKVTARELGFIWYAGLIRGAIAFGLVLRLDDTIINKEVIITTSLLLVVTTTVFLGSTVALLGKYLLEPAKPAHPHEPAKEIRSPGGHIKPHEEEEEKFIHPNEI